MGKENVTKSIISIDCFMDSSTVPRNIILAIIVIITLSIGVYAVSRYYAAFNMHENVKDSYHIIDLSLNISQEGSKTFQNITTVEIGDDTSIQFRVLHSEAVGDLKIIVGGRAILESSGKRYVIDVPCMLVKDMPCYRIQMLIPGYDRPLKVEPGTYSVTIAISWRAEGRGFINVKLAMLRVYGRSEAQIFPIGTKPYNATGWIVANGSTRSYALLVDKTSVDAGGDGYGYIRVWAWLFSPSSENETKTFRFQLVRIKDGCIAAELDLPVEKHGIYYQALLLVKAKAGEYKLKAIFPINVEVEVPIGVYRPI